MGQSDLRLYPIPSTYLVENDHFSCGFLNGYFSDGVNGKHFF